MLNALTAILILIFLSLQNFSNASTRPRCFVNDIEGVCMRASQCPSKPGFNVIALLSKYCGDEEKCCLLDQRKTATQPKKSKIKSKPIKRMHRFFANHYKVDTQLKAARYTDPPLSGIVALEYQLNSTSEPKICCGGSLIHDRFVLTAAHCVTGEYTRNICGDLQSVRVFHQFERQSILIRDIVRHPNYVVNETGEYKYLNDIALVELYSEKTLAERSEKVLLPIGKINSRISTDLTVFGWGRTEEGETSEWLKMVEQPLVDHSICQNIYSHNHVVGKDQFCAGGVEDEGTCNGDSGGPLMRIEGNKLFIEGIVSWSREECGVKDVPTVYTRVRSYVLWIVKTMRN